MPLAPPFCKIAFILQIFQFKLRTNRKEYKQIAYCCRRFKYLYIVEEIMVAMQFQSLNLAHLKTPFRIGTVGKGSTISEGVKTFLCERDSTFFRFAKFSDLPLTDEDTNTKSKILTFLLNYNSITFIMKGSFNAWNESLFCLFYNLVYRH